MRFRWAFSISSLTFSSSIVLFILKQYDSRLFLAVTLSLCFMSSAWYLSTSLDIFFDEASLVISNRYFVLFIRRFFCCGNIQDAVGIDVECNTRRKFYGKNHDTCSPRSVSLFQLCRPFALSISLILPFVPFADRQHPNAYPNSLTIPIEPLPIRAPMATGRKESRDMGESPLPSLLSFEPSYIFSLSRILFSSRFLFFIARLASWYSSFRSLLPRRIVFLSPTSIVGNVY